jgi:hypothetical protein
MTTKTSPTKVRPSLWAVALLFASSGFAIVSIVLASGLYPA